MPNPTTMRLYSHVPFATLLALLSSFFVGAQDVNCSDHIVQLEQVVSEIQSQAIASQQKIALAQSSMLRQLTEAKVDLVKTQAELSRLKSEHTNTLQELDVVRHKLNETTHQLNELQDYKSDMEDLKSEIEVLKSGFNATEEGLENMQSNVKSMNLNMIQTDSTLMSMKQNMTEYISESKGNQWLMLDKLQDLDKRVNGLQNGSVGGHPLSGCNNKVIFQANLGYLRNRNVRGNTTVIFQNVDVNVGAGLNPATGVFTASVPGIYYFWVSLDSMWADLDLNIMKNKQIIAGGENKIEPIYKAKSSQESQSAHVALNVAVSLMKGDQVTVETTRNQKLYFNAYSSFGGMTINC